MKSGLLNCKIKSRLASLITTGIPQALEIMENLEKFYAWKIHGILKNLNNHGKIMEFCEII